METVKQKRTGAKIAVYLILKREEETLLLLRQNTGYMDGFYGLVSGHVENDESAVTAMIREAHEESGITIKEENCSHDQQNGYQ